MEHLYIRMNQPDASDYKMFEYHRSCFDIAEYQNKLKYMHNHTICGLSTTHTPEYIKQLQEYNYICYQIVCYQNKITYLSYQTMYDQLKLQNKRSNLEVLSEVSNDIIKNKRMKI